MVDIDKRFPTSAYRQAVVAHVVVKARQPAACRRRLRKSAFPGLYLGCSCATLDSGAMEQWCGEEHQRKLSVDAAEGALSDAAFQNVSIADQCG